MTDRESIELHLFHALRHLAAALMANRMFRHTEALAHLKDARSDLFYALKQTKPLAELEASK